MEDQLSDPELNEYASRCRHEANSMVLFYHRAAAKHLLENPAPVKALALARLEEFEHRAKQPTPPELLVKWGECEAFPGMKEITFWRSAIQNLELEDLAALMTETTERGNEIRNGSPFGNWPLDATEEKQFKVMVELVSQWRMEADDEPDIVLHGLKFP